MDKIFFEEADFLRNISKEVNSQHFSKIPSSNKKTEVIEEGIKYFKISPRLYKLAIKLERKSLKFKENESKFKEIDTLCKKINALANDFEILEDYYYVSKNKADKAKMKIQYDKLVKEYASIIKMMKKSEVIDGLKTIGSLSLTVASMALPYIAMSKFFPNLVSINNINQESKFWPRTNLFLKRAGAFVLCGIPIKAVRAGFTGLTNNIETKVLARTDSLLKDTEVDMKDYNDDELHQLT